MTMLFKGNKARDEEHFIPFIKWNQVLIRASRQKYLVFLKIERGELWDKLSPASILFL